MIAHLKSRANRSHKGKLAISSFQCHPLCQLLVRCRALHRITRRHQDTNIRAELEKTPAIIRLLRGAPAITVIYDRWVLHFQITIVAERSACKISPAAAMVSPDTLTEGSSMDERERQFYSRIASRQPPPSSSPSESESQSDSSEHVSSLTQKKITAKTVPAPSKQPPSSAKRPRNEDDEPANKKSKKPKPSKEDPKNTNGDKRKVTKPEPLPSPQKSAKKPGVWNPKDQVTFLKGVAAYCQDGKEFPKNALTPVYDYVRSLNLLGHEYNNSQLGEKFRRLRTRFLGMEDKVKGGSYSFKNAHEEAVYKLSKRIWGKEEDAEESEDEESESSEELAVKGADVGNGAKEDGTLKKVVQDEAEEEEEEEEEGNKSTGEDVEMTPKEDGKVEEEDEEDESNKNQGLFGLRKHAAVKEEVVATSHVVSNGTISNGVQDNNVAKLIDQPRKDYSAVMNEFKDKLSRGKEELKNAVLKMVREGIDSALNEKTRNDIGFSSEEMVRKIYSARDLPTLDVSEARMLEQKWQRQFRVELEACSGHLALLQEECEMRMEKLRSLVDEERR